MPIYDYQCPNGHVHERHHIQADDFQPRTCTECMKPAERIMSLPAKRTDGIYSYRTSWTGKRPNVEPARAIR